MFEKVVSIENLFRSAHKAMLGKRGKAPAARCFVDLERTVINLHQQLSDGTWRPGPYHYFMIYEPKEREVAAAVFRDRIVHHAIVKILEPIFDKQFISDSYACRVGKGNHACLHRTMEFTKRYKYCLKCDIQKYFPHIDHKILRSLIERHIKDDRLMSLIDLIIGSHADNVSQVWEKDDDLFSVTERPRGLPIGNLTSQFFANIYLHSLDYFVKHDLRVKGYIRYVDDFLLFGDDRALLKNQGRQVREYVKTLRLNLHPDKFRMMATNNGVDMVGFVQFPNGRIRVRDKNVRLFSRRLDRQAWLVRRGYMDIEDLRTRAKCWIAHSKNAQTRGLRRDIFKPLNLSGYQDNIVFLGIRGGSFNNNANNLASEERNYNNANDENYNIGFRVVSLQTEKTFNLHRSELQRNVCSFVAEPHREGT